MHRRATTVIGVGLLAALIATRLAVLDAMYHDPAHQRDDYRGIAAEVERLAGPEDAVVLDAPTQIEVFGYYDRGRHATYPLPRTRPAERRDTEDRLAAAAKRHRDLYVVLWATGESDPEGIVEGWLNEHRYKVRDTWHGNVRLAMWADSRPMISQLQDIQFGDAMKLRRLARPADSVRAGDVVTLEADWQATHMPGANYVVFTQLLDSAGQLVAQRDMAPVGGSELTATWPPGHTATDRIGLRVPPSLAPGNYTVILGLYDAASGERQPAWGAGPGIRGDHVTVGPLHVRP